MEGGEGNAIKASQWGKLGETQGGLYRAEIYIGLLLFGIRDGMCGERGFWLVCYCKGGNEKIISDMAIMVCSILGFYILFLSGLHHNEYMERSTHLIILVMFKIIALNINGSHYEKKEMRIPS